MITPLKGKSTGAKSIVDHCMLSQNLYETVPAYEVIHERDNLSDHSLLAVSISMDAEVTYLEHDISNNESKPIWTKASEEQVELCKIALGNNLNTVNVPWNALYYRDLLCHDKSYIIYIIHIIIEFHD